MERLQVDAGSVDELSFATPDHDDFVRFPAFRVVLNKEDG